jgi:ribosome maturation factor RimP
MRSSLTGHYSPTLPEATEGHSAILPAETVIVCWPEVGTCPPFVSKGLVRVDVEALVRPVVEQAGYELVELAHGVAGGRRTMRVTVDRPEGLDVDAIAALSEKIARRLDLEDFGEGRYELEVSSPGIERPLRTPTHFARFVGTQVKVKTTASIDGARVHQGLLVASDETGITVEVEGVTRHVSYADIASARTVADWDAELKGTKV